MVRRRVRMMRMGRCRAEPDEIDDFKDADRVDNEKCDEPPFLTAAGGIPERVPFQDNSPD